MQSRTIDISSARLSKQRLLEIVKYIEQYDPAEQNRFLKFRFELKDGTSLQEDNAADFEAILRLHQFRKIRVVKLVGYYGAGNSEIISLSFYQRRGELSLTITAKDEGRFAAVQHKMTLLLGDPTWNRFVAGAAAVYVPILAMSFGLSFLMGFLVRHGIFQPLTERFGDVTVTLAGTMLLLWLVMMGYALLFMSKIRAMYPRLLLYKGADRNGRDFRHDFWWFLTFLAGTIVIPILINVYF